MSGDLHYGGVPASLRRDISDQGLRLFGQVDLAKPKLYYSQSGG
jgi:hypothetical protein